MTKPVRLKLLRDLFALSGGQLVSKIIGFLAFVYLARTLDPESYGALEYAVGLAAVFGMVIDWGLGPIGVREISRAPDRLARMAALIPTGRLGVALIAIPVMGFSTAVTGQTGAARELIWLYALGLFAVCWKQDWLLQSREMMAAAAAGEAVRMTAFALGVVVFVHTSQDLVAVGVIEIAAVAIWAAYYLVVQQAWIAPVRLRVSFGELRRLMPLGISVGLSNMIWAIIQYAPLFFVANLVGGTQTAWFGASHRVVVSLLAFSWVYHFNLYPAIARRAGETPEELGGLVGASFRVVAWSAILLALVLTLLARPLLVLAFGEPFAAAAPAFAVLVWVLPVTLLSGHTRWAMIATGHQRYVLYAHIAGAVAVVIVGAAAVPAFHAVGAAAAMLAASLAVWAVAHASASAYIGRQPGVSVAGLPLLVAAPSGILAHLVAASPWGAAAMAATAYVLCALLIDRRLLADFQRLAHAKAAPVPRTNTTP